HGPRAHRPHCLRRARSQDGRLRQHRRPPRARNLQPPRQLRGGHPGPGVRRNPAPLLLRAPVELGRMSAPRFVHLRLHTEYSVVDGMARVDDAVAAAAADGMPALAITDLANVFGAVKFYEAARGKGVQPVIGCDAWITNERNRDAAYRVALLCRSREGYLHLCDLLTRAYAENQWRGRAEMKREWLTGTHGLLVLSGAGAGDVGMALASGNVEQADELARGWSRDFPGAFYIELQRVEPTRSAAFVQASVALAARVGLPVVA